VSTTRLPRILVGHSLGGAAVLAAASNVREAQAVATIGAPFDPTHVTQIFDIETPAAVDRAGEVAVQIGGRPFRIGRQFLVDVNEYHLGEAIRNLRKALLVFHAPRDQIVDIDNARRIFEAAMHPKSFVSLDNADHLLTRTPPTWQARSLLWQAVTSDYRRTRPLRRPPMGPRAGSSSLSQDMAASPGSRPPTANRWRPGRTG
jgi:putative redox protein